MCLAMSMVDAGACINISSRLSLSTVKRRRTQAVGKGVQEGPHEQNVARLILQLWWEGWRHAHTSRREAHALGLGQAVQVSLLPAATGLSALPPARPAQRRSSTSASKAA